MATDNGGNWTTAIASGGPSSAEVLTTLITTLLSSMNPAGDNVPTTSTTTMEPTNPAMFRFSPANSIASIVLSAVTTTITVIGNLAVLISFYLERPLRRNVSNYLIVSLATCDLILGATCPTQWIFSLVTGWWPFGWVYCQMWIIISFAFVILTQTNSFFIAVDRFLIVKYKHNYHAWRTARKVLCLIVFMWVSTIVSSLCVYKWGLYDRFPDFNKERPICLFSMARFVKIITYIFTYIVRLLLMAGMYIYLFRATYIMNKRIAGYETTKKSREVEEKHSIIIDDDDSNQNNLNSLPDKERNVILPGSRVNLGATNNAWYTQNIDNQTQSNTNNGCTVCEGHLLNKLDTIGNASPVHLRLNTNTNSKVLSGIDGASSMRSEVSAMEEINEQNEKNGRITMESPSRDLGFVKECDEASPNLSPGASITRVKSATEKLIQRRMTKSLWAVSFIFIANIIFYGPYSVMTILVNSFGIRWPSLPKYGSIWLMYQNSMVNPFMYALVNPLFKETIIRLFKCDWHRNKSATTTQRMRNEQVKQEISDKRMKIESEQSPSRITSTEFA